MRNFITLVMLALLFLSHAPLLFSEVENLTIKWIGSECHDMCMGQLRREFLRIPGIEELTMKEGEADIKWRKHIPFSLTAVKMAMRLIGLSIQDIRVTVRGIVKQDASSPMITLISLGDHSSFLLINPDISKTSEQATDQAAILSQEMSQKLLEARAKHQIATIEGSLFMIERSPPAPVMLVVESLNFAERKQAH